MNKRHITLLATILLAATLAAAFLVLQRADSPPEIQSGVLLSQPKALPRFDLVDHHRQPFTRQQLAGRWSLLFTGFASCPDVCPVTLFELGSLDQRLRAEGTELQMVFLSVDPARDTPDVLAPYVEYFSETIVGVTGELSEIDRLCGEMGTGFVHIPDAGGEYTVEHSGALVLIDPLARISGYFKPPFDLERLAEDLQAVTGGGD